MVWATRRDWSFKVIKRPGQTTTECVDSAQKELLGETGQEVLNATSATSLPIAILTRSPGSTLALAERINYKIHTTKMVPKPSLLGRLFAAGAEEGTVSAGTATAVETGSRFVGKVAVPVAVVSTGIELGFWAACTF